MENLPPEILYHELGNHLDIKSMIQMSYSCKNFEQIYHSKFTKLVKEIDPFIENGTVHDFLRITRIGPISYVKYKIWKILFQSIVKELEGIYPYMKRKEILHNCYQIVPTDLIQTIHKHIEHFIFNNELFFIFNDNVYKNPYHSSLIVFPEPFELDLNDMIDSLLHEMAVSQKEITRDVSIESLTDESNLDSLEYFPYDNVTEAIESWLRYL
jgi:hypothetical protein